MRETPNPVPAFSFELNFSGNPSEQSNGFSEVSGLKADMGLENVSEGGENRFTTRIPTRAKYENLQLKRGIMKNNSSLTKWCLETINGASQTIEPKDIRVTLRDEAFKPLVSWEFKNAWPVSWSIMEQNSPGKEIIVESLEFSFTYFTRQQH